MSVLETAIVYGLVGIVVALALSLSGGRRRLVPAVAAGMYHAALWPFFAPFLLGRAIDGEARTGPVRGELSGPVEAAEARLRETLTRVGGVAEEVLGPQLETVTSLCDSLRRMERRRVEMGELLESPEFDGKEVVRALEALEGRGEDWRVESLEARLRHIERLKRMHEKTTRNVEETLLKLDEMTAQIALLQFADPGQGEVAFHLEEIALTIEGLSESLLGVHEP